MKLIKTLVHRPSLVIVVFLITMIFGLFSYSRLPIDMLPDMEVPVISIVTVYPGGSALDVEGKISEPIEEALSSIPNLDQVSSTSRNNVSFVVLQFRTGTNVEEAANDVRQNLEMIKNALPSDAESPRVQKLDIAQLPIFTFAISAKGQDVRTLQEELEVGLFEPLRRVPGVGSIIIMNAPERIVRVDVYRDRLLAHGLTITEVTQILAANNLNIPAGDLDVGEMNFGLRMPAEVSSIEELRSIPLIKSPLSDAMISLGDVADVRIDLDDSSELAFVDGDVAIMGFLRKTASANTVDVTKNAIKVFEELQKDLPQGVEVEILESGANFIEGTIKNLQRTVMAGIFLVALIVFLFLRRIGPTFIVALSIPTSVITSFMVIYGLGYTLNSVTLIAMSLAVGLVVDNGVVALENISRKIDEGLPPKQAATEGASEVASALLASTLTTLVIFAPMMFISGIVGQMFAQLAVVMIVTITASLVVALTLTPMLAARLISSNSKPIPAEDEVVAPKWWEKKYASVLKVSIKKPWFTLIASLAVGVSTVFLLSMLGSDFLPQDDMGQIAFTAELPVGTSLEQTAVVGQKYIDALRAQPEVQVTSLRVGASKSGGGGKAGNNIARIQARLNSAKDRTRTDKQIAMAVMEEVGKLPEIVNLELSTQGGGGNILGSDKPIIVDIMGSNLEDLQEAALLIRENLQRIPGTVNVSADAVQTRPEIQVNFSRKLVSQAGFPVAVAGQELRTAMTGVVASRYVGDGDPKDVVVRLREEDREQVDDWKLIPVRTQQGQLSHLGAFGHLSEGESPIEIKRLDKARLLSVSLEISDRSLGDVGKDVEEMLSGLTLPDGVRTKISGAIQEQRESFGDMGLLLGMGILLVYLVMVAQFESWLTPFVIMFSVPFAATGAFLALLLTGTNLSVTSFLGLVILIGVVVNNAIVLIDYIQLLQAKGLSLVDAVVQGGERRLRPVLITTLTTSGGMLPLALTTGEGEQLWGPMGKTALGGLLVSSAVTLILVPTMYVIVSRIRKKSVSA